MGPNTSLLGTQQTKKGWHGGCLLGYWSCQTIVLSNKGQKKKTLKKDDLGRGREKTNKLMRLAVEEKGRLNEEDRMLSDDR